MKFKLALLRLLQKSNHKKLSRVMQFFCTTLYFGSCESTIVCCTFLSQVTF
uniref:Uncharacterized protein n=1 Tax=Arundo donax TaxID=35708 RepID=A0A0A8YWN0_ARUDO